MTFDLQWAAAAGPDPINLPTDDLIASTVHQLRPETKRVASEALAALAAVQSRDDLSPIGKDQLRQEIGTKAITLIQDRTSTTAARAELTARHAAAPVPGIDSVPNALVQPLLTALAGIDPLQREVMALDWLRDGDMAPATLLAHASGPLSLVDKAARSRLSEALRVAGNAPAASQARQLSEALESTDRAAKAAIALVSRAAGIKARDATAGTASGTS